MADLERRLRGLAAQPSLPPTPVAQLERRARRRRTARQARLAVAMVASVAIIGAAVVTAWPDDDRPPVHVAVAPAGPEQTTTTQPALPPLPTTGLAYQDGESTVVLTDISGKELTRLEGYQLDTSDRPGPLGLDGPNGHVVLDPPSGRLVAHAGTPLVGGAELRSPPLRVTRPGQPDWDLAFDDVFVSHRRDLVTAREIRNRTEPDEQVVSSQVLDLRTGERRSLPPACSAADREGTLLLLVCREGDELTVEWLTSEGRRSVLHRMTDPHGRWVAAYLGGPGPVGSSILLQHSGECEMQTGYRLITGELRPVGLSDGQAVESEVADWLPDGSALVYLGEGVCGAGYRGPGMYTVGAAGDAQLVIAGRNAKLWRPLD